MIHPNHLFLFSRACPTIRPSLQQDVLRRLGSPFLFCGECHDIHHGNSTSRIGLKIEPNLDEQDRSWSHNSTHITSESRTGTNSHIRIPKESRAFTINHTHTLINVPTNQGDGPMRGRMLIRAPSVENWPRSAKYDHLDHREPYLKTTLLQSSIQPT